MGQLASQGFWQAGESACQTASVNLNAPGIDVGTSRYFVAIPANRVEQLMQEYEAFTAELYRPADWLSECGVQMVSIYRDGSVEKVISRGSVTAALEAWDLWSADAV